MHKIAPPVIELGFSQRAPKKCPINTPINDKTVVTTPIVIIVGAISICITANAKPLIIASILVARASKSTSPIQGRVICTSRRLSAAISLSRSDFPRTASLIIFIPKNARSTKAIRPAFTLIKLRNSPVFSSPLTTQKPISGIPA